LRDVLCKNALLVSGLKRRKKIDQLGVFQKKVLKRYIHTQTAKPAAYDKTKRLFFSRLILWIK